MSLPRPASWQPTSTRPGTPMELQEKVFEIPGTVDEDLLK
jgi:hypothetical protein